MPQGTIKKVLADKGFGFIEGERGNSSSTTALWKARTIETLQIGQPVTYEEGRGPKGPRAENVKPIN